MIRRASLISSLATAAAVGSRTLLLGAAIALSACETISSQSTEPNAATNPKKTDVLTAQAPSLEEVALDDLVRALVQYRNPITTTLQAGLDMANEDEKRLLAKLSDIGYGLQLVDADQGANLLSHNVEDIPNSGTPTQRHTLKIGRLALTREYATINEKTRPIGPLNVAGSRRRISLDDQRFGEAVANDRLVSRIAFSFTEEVDADDAPRISLLQLPMNATDQAVGVGTNTSGLEVSNVFYGDNNFGSLLDEYQVIETMSVIFPNDSMRLGNIGRLKIDVFLGDFDEESDLIRVVGCSNGKTTVKIGNEGLALGRAERVTQELLARGVTREHILDEGCWSATSAGDRFPSRGVVLELYRDS